MLIYTLNHQKLVTGDERMWQAPSQRSRAISASKKREQARKRRSMHVKRVYAQIKIIGALGAPPSPIVEVRVLLNDFSPSGLGLFSSQEFFPGQQIAITLEQPQRFFVEGMV